MPKSRSKGMRKQESMHYKCDCYHHKVDWILPLLIIAVALVPNWYGTMWAKWTIVVAAAVVLSSRFCKCC